VSCFLVVTTEVHAKLPNSSGFLHTKKQNNIIEFNSKAKTHSVN